MSTQAAELAFQGTRGRVLSVDDCPVVRAMVRGYLKSGGYQVEEAADAPAALRRVANGSYDVVITDVHMPELDGFGLLAAVQREAPGTEVVFLTGAHRVELAIRALRLGAHDYLTKPLTSADAVIGTVDRALEKKRLHQENEELLRKLEERCGTDRLTGLVNRRGFEETLAREVTRARRHGHALSVVLLEISSLPAADDALGRGGQDEVVRWVAGKLKGGLRAGDGLFRYGAQLFAAILPYVELAGAQRAADRFVEGVTAGRATLGTGDVSIELRGGVASLLAQDSEFTLLRRASAALDMTKSTSFLPA